MTTIAKDLQSAGPLSYSEQAGWDEFRTDPESFFARGAVLAVEVDSGLDDPGVVELVALICARHEIFRTSYQAVAGRPVRRILAEYRHLIEVGEGSRPARPRGESLTPADLVRIRLAPGPAGVRTLYLGLHEMITDPWSCARLRDELLTLQKGLVTQGKPGLAEVSVSYAEYAGEERDRPLPAALEQYWQHHLEQAATATGGPPADGPDPSGDPAGERIMIFPDQLTETLRSLCREHRMSPFMAITGLVNMTVATLYDTHDVILATTASTRTGKWADVQGNFSNITVLRTTLTESTPFSEVMTRTRGTVMGALRNQPMPYLRLTELIAGRLARPTIRVHYLPSRAHHYSAVLDSKPSGAAWAEETDFAGWPLDLGFAEDNHRRIAIWASYDTRLFTHRSVQRLIDGCRAVLELVGRDPSLTSRALREGLAAQRPA